MIFAKLKAQAFAALAFIVGIASVVLRIQYLKSKAEKAQRKAEHARVHAQAAEHVVKTQRRINANRTAVQKQHKKQQEKIQQEIKKGDRSHMEDTW